MGSKLKKITAIVLAACLAAPLFGCRRANENDYDDVIDSGSQKAITAKDIDTKGIKVGFRAEGKYIYEKKGKSWNAVCLKGVNMGLTQPTTELDNPNVSYSTYIGWFGKIAAMNANTIKVFTIMNPDFYKALCDYNKEHAGSELYLLQGIWFNEDYMYDVGDAWDDDSVIINAFEKAARETVDIIHGNSSDTSYGEWSPAVYSSDVSEYLAGYIMGLEWPAEFVSATNEGHAGKTHNGKYLCASKNASAFEAFLARAGDCLIEYETKNYKAQTPLAFLNWSTTDPLEHTNEPFPEEDAVGVDTENIEARSGYYAGRFEAIDIYPYYPEFLNYQEEYVSYTDSSGRKNPYAAYITELISHYSVPVLVAEFGIPTSRGKAHKSVMGYDQGGVTEQQQGEYVSAMAKDIFAAGYCGAAVFSWQDEWFKQTWNTVKYSPDRAARRTVNAESAEQHYGILAYEPGETPACLVDGDFSEWNKMSPAVRLDDKNEMYVKYDEEYLYLYLKTEENELAAGRKFYIPISTLGVGSREYKKGSMRFSENVDYILEIDGKDGTRLLTDSYRDVFHYIYAVEKGVFEKNESYKKRGAGIYNSVYSFLSNEIVLPVSKKTIKPVKYESGKLKYGNSNPDAQDYDSLADFCFAKGGAEFRLPWYLLGVVNPADKISVDDCYKNRGVDFTAISGVKVGLWDQAQKGKTVLLADSGFTGIKKVSYHERLKKSYDIIKNTFAKLSLK